MSHWTFILNPVAGAGRLQKKWPQMRQTLKAAKIDFTEHWTTARGDASQMVQDLIKAGQLNIVGVGGDGTNNELLNGIYSQKFIPAKEIMYALLPFGTGNDWVRTHGIFHHLPSWIRMLKEGHSILHDLGWVDFRQDGQHKRRYFANVAGLAYDAHIVKVADGYQHGQKSKSLYLWLVIKELLGFEPPLLELNFNERKVERHFYTINIGICKYSGGGMQLVSHADPQSGQLALTLIRKFPKWRVILDTPKLYTGNLSSHPYTEIAHTKKLNVQAVNGADLWVEADGELLGQGPLTFGVESEAVRVVVPKQAPLTKLSFSFLTDP